MFRMFDINFTAEARLIFRGNPEGAGESLPTTEKKGGLGVSEREKATRSNMDRAVDTAKEANVKLKEQRAKEQIAVLLKKGLEQGDLDKTWQKATEQIQTEYIAYRDKVAAAYDKMLEGKVIKSGGSKDVTADNSDPDGMGTRSEGSISILPPPEDVVALFNKKLIPAENVKKPVAEKMNKYLESNMIELHVYENFKLADRSKEVVNRLIAKVLPQGFKALVPDKIRKELKKYYS